MKKTIVAFMISVLLLGCGIQQIEEVKTNEPNTFITISSEEAQRRFEEESGYVILDVRRVDEYQSGHIPNSINIPNETITESILEELPDLNQTIYIYCRSGNRSKQAASKLIEMGYTNVIDFGGIQTWPGEIEEGD